MTKATSETNKIESQEIVQKIISLAQKQLPIEEIASVLRFEHNLDYKKTLNKINENEELLDLIEHARLCGLGFLRIKSYKEALENNNTVLQKHFLSTLKTTKA